MISGTAIGFVYVADIERALGFYRDTLGMSLRSSDPYGCYLEAGGAQVRLTALDDHKPHEHPVFGWSVADFDAAAEALRARGIRFTVYEGMTDERGVYTAEGGEKLAWFADPDGNMLMLSTG